MSSGKSFRPITRNEFETDEADKEVQNIISGHEDEERQAREAYALYVASVARTAREYHQREKDKGGFCVTQGGRIKNIFRNKNKSNKSKSKRINKRIKKNKRNSRKHSRKLLKK